MPTTVCPNCGQCHDAGSEEAANEPVWLNQFGARNQWCAKCLRADEEPTMSDPRIDVDLLTRDGSHVTTVKLPPFQVPPEIIRWGERFFVRCQDGTYREGLVWVADAPA